MAAVVSRCRDVCAVVVTYCFYGASLEKCLTAISPQVGEVVLVDNGSPNAGDLIAMTAALTNAHSIFLQGNAGIAAAQNRGMEYALDAGFEYMILFDQDSIPSEGMVETLRQAHVKLRSAGQKVAAVGPRLFDPRLERYLPFYTYAGGRYAPIGMDAAAEFVRTPILISSGLFFHRDVIMEAGFMEAGLFIDHVDHEWGFRVQAKQYSLYGVPPAVLSHEIGGEIVLIEGIEFQKHAPTRYYYMFRNSLLLYKRCYVPLEWKQADFRDRWSLLKLCMDLLRPRRDNLRMIFRGLVDGLAGKTGDITRRKKNRETPS